MVSQSVCKGIANFGLYIVPILCLAVVLEHVEGDRPGSTVWKLGMPQPVRLFREFGVLREV